MKLWAEEYLDHLNTIGDGEPKIHRASPPDEFPALSIVTYSGVSGYELKTSFTVGLSAVSHPKWKFGRPELCICVESDDLHWESAIGYIAYNLRGKCSFSYGEIIRFGRQICNESEMSAFVVFAPSFINKEQLHIQLLDWKVNIAQMYPIYEGEIDFIEENGLKAFFANPTLDLYDVRREDTSRQK